MTDRAGPPGGHLHVMLSVENSGGSRQPVEVEPLGRTDFRVLHTPGFVEGCAAGDVIRITDVEAGDFDVIARGGNLAIKVFTDGPVREIRAFVERELAAIGGWCDGGIAKAAVFTVPVGAGFEAIEDVMARAIERHPGAEWWYGNVYAADGVTRLGWWARG